MLFSEFIHEIGQCLAGFFCYGVVNRCPAAPQRPVTFDTYEIPFCAGGDEFFFQIRIVNVTFMRLRESLAAWPV